MKLSLSLSVVGTLSLAAALSGCDNSIVRVSSCTAAVRCATNPNAQCATGVTSCDKDTEVCVDATPLDAGLSCGANLVCNGSGVCVACAGEQSCTSNPGGACVTGITSCALGHSECLDAAKVDAGTPCGVGKVCDGAGTCLGCNPDDRCTANPGGVCFRGATVCGSGQPTCRDDGAVDAGVTCGAGLICNGSGSCVSGCAIDGVFVAPGAFNPSNGCQNCQPSVSATAWSATNEAQSSLCPVGQACHAGACSSGCVIGGLFYDAGTPSGACQSCQPQVTTSNWSNTNEALPSLCANGSVCRNGSCQVGCGVNLVFYDAGAALGSCSTCQPGVSATSFTAANEGSVSSCDAGTACHQGLCVAGCGIASTWYSPGSTNGACQSCVPSTTASAWSGVNEATSSSCDAGTVCHLGACTAGCGIGSVFYIPDAGHPTLACESCQPAASTSTWSNSNDGDPCSTGGCSRGACFPNVTVPAGTTVLTTTSLVGRSCADEFQAQVASLTTNSATLTAAPPMNCFAVGDEVMLINLQGRATAYGNAGNYELLTVSNVAGSVVTFATAKTRSYGDGMSDDLNIGTGTGKQHVALIRVPQYGNLIVPNGATLTTSAWNRNLGGVLTLRAGTVTVQTGGVISAKEFGYMYGLASDGSNGGAGCAQNVATGSGESISGESVACGALSPTLCPANVGGSGGTQATSGGFGGNVYTPAGASHATAGTIGIASAGRTPGDKGQTYGSPNAVQLTLGSGSGGGFSCGNVGCNICSVDFGLNMGGGIVALYGGSRISVQGSITANGRSLGGAGSGGYVALQALSLDVGTQLVTAVGGVGTHGAAGIPAGDGYISLQYRTSVTGTTSPVSTPQRY